MKYTSIAIEASAPEGGDKTILENVMRKITENVDCTDVLEMLLRTQLANSARGKDPRQRRWTPEIIQLCLTFIADKQDCIVIFLYIF